MFVPSGVKVGGTGVRGGRIIHPFHIPTSLGKVFFDWLKLGHEVGTLAQSQTTRPIRVVFSKLVDQIHGVVRLASVSAHESWALAPLLILSGRHFDLDELSFEKLVSRMD
jgi:hypothetical protein